MTALREVMTRLDEMVLGKRSQIRLALTVSRTRMKILVFGATGFVGGRLVPHLAAKGHEVTVAARSAAVFPGEVRTILADPMKPGAENECQIQEVIDALVGSK